MTKKIKYIIFLSFLFIIGICTNSFARITTNDPTVNSGETVKITINSQEPVASGAIDIESNSGLKFESVSGGTNNGTLVSFSDSKNKTSGIATYTFTAPKVTQTTTYKVVFKSKDMADEEGKPINSSNATATVTVKAPAQSGGNTDTKPNTNTNTNTSKSSDATLKSITVGGKTYSKPSTSITAPNVSSTTSSIKINATVNNSKAKVSGTGTKDLKTGTNKFTLKVTAENGNTKTYTITVVKLAEESTEPNLPDESNTEEQKLRLTSLGIEGAELSPEFKDDVFEYSTNIFDVSAVRVNAVSSDPEAIMEITGDTDLIDGENTVVVKLTKGENVVEYKIKVIKIQLEPQETEEQNTIEETNDFNFLEFLKRHSTLLIVCLGILISTGVAIGFGITIYKYSNKTKKEKPISKHSKVDFKKEDK